MRPAPRRCPLDELQALGQEDAHRGPRVEAGRALERAAVERDALCLPGLEPDLEPVPAVRVDEIQRHARHARAPPHDLALVRGARRAGRAAEVDGLHRLVLPAPLAPQMTVSPSGRSTAARS